MIKKNNKFFTLGVIALGVTLGAGVISSVNPNIMLLRMKAADDVVNGSITFSCSSATRTQVASYKYTFKGTTNSGYPIYLYSYNNYSINNSSGLVASFGGSSYSGKYLSFSSSATEEVHYDFQYVTSISITTKSTSGTNATFNIINSDGGNVAYSGTISASQTQTISSQVLGSKYLKLVPTSTEFLDIATVTINYSCSPSGEPIDPGDDPEEVTTDTYSATISSRDLTLDFNSDGSGLYTYYYDGYTYTTTFTWSRSGDALTLVKGESDAEASYFGNYNLFGGSATTNTTGSISGSTLSIKTYNAWGTGYTRSLTKQ